MTVIVAIDGPSGSGKSTVARGVAGAFGFDVLDTGAMYRAVTLAALERGVDPADADACALIADEIRLEVGDLVLLDGRDVTSAIRSPEVTATVSQVSAHPAVRRELVERQRAWVTSRSGGVVEGRDIGTVVFPDAPLKVYLTADPAERAHRRAAELRARGEAVDEAGLARELSERDRRDSARAHSPLRPAPDAVVLDTSGIPLDAVVERIVHEVEARHAAPPR